MRIGVDSGGTFTDFAWDGGVLKLPSTPHDPAEAIVGGIKQILAAQPLVDPLTIEIMHGSTVATNALLTRSGARVALLTTAGFEDVIEIGRQDRPELYDLHPQLPPPLVPRDLRVGVRERIAVNGQVLEPLTEEEVETTIEAIRRLQPVAVAICLLHSYAHPQHEQQLGNALRNSLELPVFLSSELDPEPREYERTSTTVIHAYLAAKVQRYLRELEVRLTTAPCVLTSNGGLATIAQAAARPADLVLSGPAGGVIGAARIAALAGVRSFIGLDMGGTSTDVCLGWNGAVAEDSGRDVTGLQLRVSRLAVHTVGAGGGSIARVGLGGTLLVGPESAGADPGPAAYGQGELPTVTDADIVLGRITEDEFGGIKLSLNQAHQSIERLGKQLGLSAIECAKGIIAIADQRMAHAAAEISQARGYDPRRCTLIPFGGAGPLHACGVAAQLGITRILIPPAAGVLSAIGAAVTAPRKDATASLLRVLDKAALEVILELQRQLTRELRRQLAPPLRFTVTLHCRYAGQSFELPVAFKRSHSAEQVATRFYREHRRVNGYWRVGEPIEVVTLQVTANGADIRQMPNPGQQWRGLPARSAVGPVAWSESTCSVYVAAGWRWHRRDHGGLQYLEIAQ
jgi:N-methylhydantoinase A